MSASLRQFWKYCLHNNYLSIFWNTFVAILQQLQAMFITPIVEYPLQNLKYHEICLRIEHLISQNSFSMQMTLVVAGSLLLPLLVAASLLLPLPVAAAATARRCAAAACRCATTAALCRVSVATARHRRVFVSPAATCKFI